jgi:O-acetyl-ADP-ribose deacetylase (regulator of RNase III)
MEAVGWVAVNAITYTDGDATCPVGDGIKVIAHICNDIGKWGKGFVLAITAKFGPVASHEYVDWVMSGQAALGKVQFLEVSAGTYVANMVAQHDIYSRGGVPPIRYAALAGCLAHVADFAAKHDECSIHMPRIGAGLAGGSWPKIAAIIDRELVQRGLSVTVYDWSP